VSSSSSPWDSNLAVIGLWTSTMMLQNSTFYLRWVCGSHTKVTLTHEVVISKLLMVWPNFHQQKDLDISREAIIKVAHKFMLFKEEHEKFI
jgi:hypothetical protein